MKKILLIASLFFAVFATAYSQAPEISKERKKAIDSLALEKVRDFTKYVSLVGDKNTNGTEAERIIQRALELFAPDAEIGVSTLGKKKVKNYKIEQYLRRLNALNYNKVKIEFYNIQYISDLERQPDGRYVGVITIYQRFEGETEDGMKYVDVTKKDITVYVERKTTQVAGRTIGFWDVLLGDVRVAETKADK
jgi:predicted ATPase